MRERAGTLSVAHQQVAATMLEDPGVRAACERRRARAPRQREPAHDHAVLPLARLCRPARVQAAARAERRRRQIDAAPRGRARRRHADGDAQGAAERGQRADEPRAARRARAARARRGAHRQGAARGLLRRGQRLDVHGERRAGALRAARHHLGRVLRRAPATDLGGHDEPQGRGARDLLRRAAAQPRSMRWRSRRSRAR